MEQSQLIIYQSEDGKVKIETRMEGETIWLTQKLMAELFQTTPQNITIHLKNIFDEGELSEESTCKEFLQVQREGKARGEYEKYHQQQLQQPTQAEKDYIRQIEKAAKKLKKKNGK